MTAKQQFLSDLQQDKDYQQHKQNAIWKEVKFYEHLNGFATILSGSYLTATVNNDYYKNNHILNSFV